MVNVDGKANIRYVSPYSIPKSNNKGILSCLKLPNGQVPSDNESLPQCNAITIPIVKTIDISSVVESNTGKLLAARTSVYYDATDELDDDLNQAGVLTGNENKNPTNFVSIDELYPQNMKQQLCTVIISNFPNVRLLAIEKILMKLIGSSFKWSLINYEFMESKSLFVRLEAARSAYVFYQQYNSNLSSILEHENIKLSVDPLLMDHFKDEEIVVDKEAPEKTITAVRLVLRNKKNIDKSNLLENVDDVSRYYSDYKVDNNELVDVPNNMREMIVKEIIKFRSSVLILEKENRKREIELERQKTKMRLKKFVEDIKETNDDTPMEDADTGVITERVDEFEDLNDDEYDKLIKERENEALEKSYVVKLAQVKNIEVNEREFLTNKLNELKNYEKNLLEQKFKYIDDLRSGLEDTSKNLLPGELKLYYHNHSAYLKNRLQKRTNEKLLDSKYEVEEVEENKRHKPEISLPIKTIVTPHEIKVEVHISELSKEKLDLLLAKVIDLVEEYLGVKDEYLVEAIMENLKTKNVLGREDLVQELTEVLDEDAVNLVNDLFAFISKSI
jgi:hypothetical protein